MKAEAGFGEGGASLTLANRLIILPAASGVDLP
jgi:hypothetical protein